MIEKIQNAGQEVRLLEILTEIMKLLKELLYKVLLIYGAVLILSYLLIRTQLINVSPYLFVFSILLFLAELHAIFHFSGILYALWPRIYAKFPHLNQDRNLQINILICVCGEPVDIVRETVIAAKEAVSRYKQVINPINAPKIAIINDGLGAGKENWLDIAILSAEQEVLHIVRTTNKGYKAGNINNAIKVLEKDDPHNTIFIVFDADFEALPEFLTEITKPFVDDTIDFVQTPQQYKNETTWVAKAAAAHQIYFFEYICPSKADDNALFLCGTNFAIRQSALDSVGRMDTKFITEDYSTSLKLHLMGKKGVFIPKVLALGIAPSTLKSYYSQQRRWAKGTFDASFAYMGKLLFGKLTLRQKFHYLLSATYYLIGLRDLILILAPIPFLYFGVSLIRENTFGFLTFIYAPLFLYNFTLYLLLFRQPLKSMVLDIISFPVFLQAFFGSLFKEKLAFIVTIKKYQRENIFKVYKTQLLVFAVLAAGLVTSILQGRLSNPLALYINYFWAGFNTFFLGLGLVLIINDNAQRNNAVVFSKRNTALFTRFPSKLFFATLSLWAFIYFLYITPGYNDLPKIGLMDELISIVPNRESVQELQIPSRGAYYGYYIPDLNIHPDNPKVNIVPGEKPSLAQYYQDWGDEQGFDREFVGKISSQNVIPIITWEPWDTGKINEEGFNQLEFLPAVIVSGKYDEYITGWAKEAASYKKPFFLRFAHEMNGNWYPWGVINGNTPRDYKNMWIHVHDIFEASGATNVIWLWAPNFTDSEGKAQSIMQFYPGEKYVDWVGFSGFNWGIYEFSARWDSFTTIANPVYSALVKTNKPIMVAETSSTTFGGDKTRWFIDTLQKDIPSYPKIKAVVFFHNNDENANFNLFNGMDANKVLRENIIENEYYIKDPVIVEKFINP